MTASWARAVRSALTKQAQRRNCDDIGTALVHWVVRPRWWLPLAASLDLLAAEQPRACFHDGAGASLNWVLQGEYEERSPLQRSQHPALDATSVRLRLRKVGAIFGLGPGHREATIVRSAEPVWVLRLSWRRPQPSGSYLPEGWQWWRICSNDWRGLGWAELTHYYRRLGREAWLAPLPDEALQAIRSFATAQHSATARMPGTSP